MFKILGAICIFAGCCTFGISQTAKMKKRVKSLETLLSAIRRISSEITFSKKRLERIFNEVSQQTGLVLFSRVAEDMHSLGFSASWQKALLSSLEDMALTRDDAECLMSLSQISAYSGEEQKKVLLSAEKLCDLSLISARDELAKSSRLFTSGGALVGMLAIILLL